MKAAIYVRVSTEEQAQEGFSIDAQLKVLRAWAVLKEAQVADEFVDDGYSAKNLNRPAMQRMLAACRAHKVDAVIVWRLDRLSRSLRDTLALVEDEFRANGVEFVSTSENIDTSSPSGRLVLNILASAAQNEREVNEERVRMVARDLAEQCVHLGGVPPYGYRVGADRRLEIDEKEAPAVRLIFSLRAQGYGYGEIISRLSEEGCRTRSGRPFGKNSLHDLLKNPKYCGVYVWNRAAAASRSGERNNHASKNPDDVIVVPGGVPAIVDSGTWQLVQARMREDARRGGAYKPKAVYICSGLVRCAFCDRAMPVDVVGRSRNGEYQRAYRCPNRCVKAIRVERLDELVLAFLDALVRDLELIPEAVEIANEILAESNAEELEEASAARQKLSALDARAKSIVDFIARAGASAPLSLMDELNHIDSERARLQKEIEKARQYPEADAGALQKYIHDVLSILHDDSDNVRRQNAIRALISRISVSDQSVYIDLRAFADSDKNGGGEGSHTTSLIFFFEINRECNAKCNGQKTISVSRKSPPILEKSRL